MTVAAPPETSARARGIDRVIDIFECLKVQRGPMGIGEVARAIGAPRSSIYEIVNRLQAAGLLEVDERNRIFFGRSIYFYADAYLASQPLMRLGRDEVVRLSKVFGETAQLCMLVGNKYTVAFMQPGSSLFRISSEIGVLVPIPWTASGRLLVGGLSDREIRALIPDEDFRLPNGQVIDFADFLADVAKAMRNNRTITVGLSDSYTACLAAAIRDQQNHPVATICFTVPAGVADERKLELMDQLGAAAERISNRMRDQNAMGI